MDTKKLRQKILDLAIRGKLVPQDPNDEPASVLLERIREEKKQMVKEGKLKAKDIKNDTIIFKGEDNLHYEKFQDGTVKCIDDEIPFEVPEGWEWCRLSSITNIVTGSLDANAQVENGDYPFFTCGEEVLLTNSYAFNCDAILLGGNNASGDFKMHRYCGKFNAYQRVYVITSYCSIDTDYLYYHIQYYLRHLKDISIGSQTRYLKLGMIQDLLIAVPPIMAQAIISKNIESLLTFVKTIYDDGIELEKDISFIKNKILDLAIRGKLVPQDPNDEPASVLLERIRAEKEELRKQGKLKRDKKESIIYKGDDNSYYEKLSDGTAKNIDNELPFDLPTTWQWVRLKDIFELLSGRDLRTSEYNDTGNGIPYITGASNFDSDKVIINRWTCNPQVVTHIGDLLITCKGTVGETAINTIGDSHIARQIMAIRNTFSLNIDFFKICIDYYVEMLKNKSKGLIPGISRDDILYLLFPLPPENEQNKIVKTLSSYNEMLRNIEINLN